MTEPSEDQPSPPPARRGIVLTPFTLLSILWGLFRPFLIVAAVAIGFLYLLRLAGIGG